MEFSITKRIATESDTEFARKVHHSAYHGVVVRQFGNWDEKIQDDFFAKSWKPETHEIIYFNGVACGYCCIEYKPDYIFASELVILPEFQGRGIGSEILNKLKQESEQKKIPIKLQVFKENQARHLYRRLGFKDVGSKGAHIEMELDPC
ncbi:MAG: GNAT family N-acetyltransferase [Patescibacteria group bacterium]